MEITATGRFDITMTPAEPLLDGTARLTFTKTWSGEIEGTSEGILLSAGDPATGSAGYVALERFTGTVGDVAGTMTFQQHGVLADGDQRLDYAVTPGAATGALAGCTGSVELGEDHHVVVRLRLP